MFWAKFLEVGGVYTPVNKHSWLEHGPFEDVWTLLKMGIFQPAMLVYQRVHLLNPSFKKLLGEFSGCFVTDLAMKKKLRKGFPRKTSVQVAET